MQGEVVKIKHCDTSFNICVENGWDLPSLWWWWECCNKTAFKLQLSLQITYYCKICICIFKKAMKQRHESYRRFWVRTRKLSWKNSEQKKLKNFEQKWWERIWREVFHMGDKFPSSLLFLLQANFKLRRKRQMD